MNMELKKIDPMVPNADGSCTWSTLPTLQVLGMSSITFTLTSGSITVNRETI